MKFRATLLALGALLAFTATAGAQARPPAQKTGPVTIYGDGSTGNGSLFSVTPNDAAPAGSLAKMFYSPVIPGKMKLGRSASPVFDERSGQYGRGVIFDSGGSVDTPGTVTIPAGKQFDAMGWTEPNIIAGANSRTSWFDFDLTINGGVESNLYGIIGALHNKGAGNTKALYGRVVMDAGSTGVGVALVGGITTRPGVATTYGIQITNESVGGKSIDAGLILDSNTGTVVPHEFGFLSSLNVSYNQAMIQGFAKGPGDALRWVNGAGTAFLSRIKSDGTALFQGISVGDFGIVMTPSVITMPSQGVVSLKNAQREYQWQAVDGDFARLSVGGFGDAIQFRPQGNAVSIFINGGMRNLVTKARTDLNDTDRIVIAN